MSIKRSNWPHAVDEKRIECPYCNDIYYIEILARGGICGPKRFVCFQSCDNFENFKNAKDFVFSIAFQCILGLPTHVCHRNFFTLRLFFLFSCEVKGNCVTIIFISRLVFFDDNVLLYLIPPTLCWVYT